MLAGTRWFSVLDQQSESRQGQGKTTFCVNDGLCNGKYRHCIRRLASYLVYLGGQSFQRTPQEPGRSSATNINGRPKIKCKAICIILKTGQYLGHLVADDTIQVVKDWPLPQKLL